MLTARHIPNADGGLSVVELLIVITIISIVGGVAVMKMGTPNRQLKRQNVARELKVALERARFDSVKRRALSDMTPATAYSATDDSRARVIITDTSYTLITDNNRNGDLINDDGTPESGDANVTSLAGQDVVIAGTGGISLPVTVLFNQRGEATLSGGGSASFYICNASCSSPTSDNANLLLVTPTGTVNLLPGNASAPSFASANVTTIGTTTGLSNTVALP